MNDKAYSPGLEGVVAGESAISQIDIELNRLVIRGCDLVELTERASFEEVAHLLLYEDLPNEAELGQFKELLCAERHLPGRVLDLLRHAPKCAHPMSLLRTAVSALAIDDAEAGDNSHEANVRKAIRLIAKIPLLITAGRRLAEGKEPVAPKENLGQAANLLYMLREEEPAADEVRAMDTSLILYAEHGYNASTFTARVTASTLSDIYSAVTAAIGALAGPLHGGANEKAMEMLLEIGERKNAERWVLDALSARKKIMGFGHREYKTGDSRVPSMKRVGREMAVAKGGAKWPELADIVEATMEREKGIFANVDFPCGYVYYMMGIPIQLFTPIFVSSRVAGWAAHVIEQHDNNRLIRPGHIYTGVKNRDVRGVGERG